MVDLSPLTSAAVGAAALAVTTLASLLVARLPLLLRYLEVQINGADNTLLRGAIGNAAQRAVQDIAGGMRVEAAIGRMADYAQDNLPAAIARLRVPRDTLLTMCGAELARVQAGAR